MLIIRADASPSIGVGHVMRCLTIAKAYRSSISKDSAITDAQTIPNHCETNKPNGNNSSAYFRKENDSEDIQVLFICADEDSALLPRESGFAVHVLNTKPEDMKNELPVLLPVLEKYITKTLLVDSYHVTDSYLSALSQVVPVFYMDDFVEHAYPVQGIINYNFYADDSSYQKLYPHLYALQSKQKSKPAYTPQHYKKSQSLQRTDDLPSEKKLDMSSVCTAAGNSLLIGPTYAPIRTEFAQTSFTVSEKVRNILILCGGGGDSSLPLRIYETLQKECDLGITWHIVLGKYAAHCDSPKKAQLICHIDVKDMAALMASCDLCLTAGGSTVYELCAVGLPFITFSMADNQNENCRYLDMHDIALFAGSMETAPDRTLANLSKNVQRLSDDYSLRQEKSLRQKTLVDGEGAKRIAQCIIKYTDTTFFAKST